MQRSITDNENLDSAEKIPTSDLATEFKNLQMTADAEFIKAEKMQSRYHRWKGISRQLEKEIQSVNQLNKTYACLYFNAVSREAKLLTELGDTQKQLVTQNEANANLILENRELRAQLVQAKTSSNTHSPSTVLNYQTQNPYTLLHHPANNMTPNTTHQNSKPPLPSANRPGKK